MVLSADGDTLEIGYKPVLETYVREVDKLVYQGGGNSTVPSIKINFKR